MKKLFASLAIVFFASFSAYAQNTPTCGTADDTAAIQAAIDNTTPQGRVKVVLPMGQCRVSSLNVTNRQGVTIEGQGAATQIIPIQNGANVIDLTGTSTVTLRDFRICGYCDMNVVPSIGILAAQMNGNMNSDVVHIDNIRVDGKFTLAALYAYGVHSSSVAWSQFYNYQANGLTAILTSNNFFGAASAFVTINQANDSQVSDWTITGTEFHNFASGWAFWMGGVSSLRVYGGNMSSSGPIASSNAVTISGVNTYPDTVIFDGTTFYSDNPPTAPYAVGGLTAGQYITFRANKAHGMPLTQ